MSAKITDADRAAARKAIGPHSINLTSVDYGDVVLYVAQAIADAREAGALYQRRIDAAHAFDRCEQYQQPSGCYEAVNKVAASIARGAANEADQHGEFEPELMARVDRIAARAKR